MLKILHPKLLNSMGTNGWHTQWATRRSGGRSRRRLRDGYDKLKQIQEAALCKVIEQMQENDNRIAYQENILKRYIDDL